ncbi:SAM-dependent methyltransferase [Allofustis seminis]|uniref:SAM-dependent methyltransferase n=1 Tax=Allofustis seminis TaxID=166939 RepID=UPI000378AC9F|nr:SAM-dependent methyltransferase [Allofustis seminis]
MNTLYIMGLGPGDYSQLSLKVLKKIKEAPHVYVRTADHPAVQILKGKDIPMTFFDDFYEEMNEDFEKVYEKIVKYLLEQLKKGDVYYAVPGHPCVAERTVAILLHKIPNQVNIVGGQSFLDDLFQAIKIDSVEGFQLVDAFTLDYRKITPRQHVVIMQVAHSFIASHVKMELMEIYPDDHMVYFVDNAGTSLEKVEKIALYELDYFDDVNNLRSLYVPPLTRDQNMREMTTLLECMEDIHHPEHGDAWILTQSQKKLLSYLKQEVTEYEKALLDDNPENEVEELGDILMVLLHCMMALKKEEYYTIQDVLEKINQKVRFRHPHIFDGLVARTPEEVDRIWQERKRQEK